MIVLILIDIVIMIYIYLKYYYISFDAEIPKEKIEEMDSIYLGYISDKEINNNFDLILSEIINLNIKGYLTIEYDKDDISKSNYILKQNFNIEKNSLKNYELIILDFIFSGKSEITRNELEEKLKNTFDSYNFQYNEIQELLKEELIKKYVIDKQKMLEIKKFSKIYKKVSIILIIIILILRAFVLKEMSTFLIYMYMFEKVVLNILLQNASIYTDMGKQLKKEIDKYKYEIEIEEFLVDKKEMNEIVLEKKFADTLAFHINTDAKEAFIDNQIVKNAKKSVSKAVLKVVLILIIFIIIAFVLKQMTKNLTKDGIFWVYTILVIILACSADITKMLATSKRKKL